MEGDMKHRNGIRKPVAILVGGVGLVMTLAACRGASPDQPPSASVPVATPGASAAPALPDPTPAPGSERVAPDEHPEQAHLTQVTVDSLAESIANYVRDESNRQGGAFPVPDPDRGSPLGLTLTTVHRERLSRLADGRYFACADFRGPDGQIYDVDIFMRAVSTGLVPADVIVHKVNGMPRFDWSERDGVWSRIPVAGR
jgi:hypothetical protein